MLVLDANILIRAVLGRRVGQILEDYSGRGIRFYAPDDAYADAERYLPGLLAKRGKQDVELASTLRYLQTLVEPVDAETYQFHEEDARERLRGRDEEDWPVLASAWRSTARFGPKTPISSAREWLYGRPIAWRSFCKHS
jgi:predicted nucleic acid-binding protein